MSGYFAELVNDKTIIGACIGAAFSVVGAFVAYRLNVRLESKKIKSSKKEQIYEELLKLLSNMRLKHSYSYLTLIDRKHDAEQIELEKGSNAEKILMITNLYLPELKIEVKEAISEFHTFNRIYNDTRHSNFIYKDKHLEKIEKSFSTAEHKLTKIINELVEI